MKNNPEGPDGKRCGGVKSGANEKRKILGVTGDRGNLIVASLSL